MTEAGPIQAKTAALVVEGLSRAFGALKAVDQVSLDVRPGEIHAVIGPNGAGKSTLVNLITGFLVLDDGRVLLDGRDVTHSSAPERVRAGMARTFQVSKLIASQTALANVMLAVQARAGASLGFVRAFALDAELREPALAFLDQVGLRPRAEMPVRQLSHGERRQLEVAVALATGARVLLFDEPMAGLGPEDSQEMIALLMALKADHAILLIEHDMDAVFQLADRISVLVYGEVILTDTPEAVRQSAAVREAYLGDEAV
jgi:branched-chain amino acid transport system ATP-binding protein